jgi:protein-L-isoaspartate(D-aspartate) O-methyltransferase
MGASAAGGAADPGACAMVSPAARGWCARPPAKLSSRAATRIAPVPRLAQNTPTPYIPPHTPPFANPMTAVMNTEQARFNMIEQQIRPWDVLDAGVLELLSMVRREDFVPPACRALAFVDTEIPLPDGQCMLAPRVEARLLQEAQLQRHEQVLEIGAGSGFMAALLANQARSVVSLERSATLARMAASNLRHAGVANAAVRTMDGVQGLPGEAPFDVIMLSGSVAQVPKALLQQLKVGGRLIGVVGYEPMMQAVRVRRVSDTGFHTENLFDTVVPRLQGFAEPTRFSF